VRDVNGLRAFIEKHRPGISADHVTSEDISAFVAQLFEMGLHVRTQARVLSGIKAFYKYLMLENVIDQSPAALLESPKLIRKIPDVLSVSEIEKILAAVDLSEPQGQRNRTIIEVLYAAVFG
jgi:integrase/recombinase XerD